MVSKMLYVEDSPIPNYRACKFRITETLRHPATQIETSAENTKVDPRYCKQQRRGAIYPY